MKPKNKKKRLKARQEDWEKFHPRLPENQKAGFKKPGSFNK